MNVLTGLILLLLSFSAFGIEGAGFYCKSYTWSSGVIPWVYHGCQKVIYDAKGMPIDVDKNIQDIALANCRYSANNNFGCDTLIKDKKQYSYFYAYEVEGGAAMPFGEEYYDSVVLNDPALPEGSPLGTITICIQGTTYGLQNCRKLK